MTETNKGLRRRGYPQADIELAQKQREAEMRAGGQSRSLLAILYGNPAKRDAPFSELTSRQLRVRGRYGQAALLADQEALTERDPERATTAREISAKLKALARRPAQLEFDFFMANVSTGHQYHDAIRDRLLAANVTQAERLAARAVLHEIVRWLGWQTYACEKTAAELAELLGIDAAVMTRTLKLLESVGAIARVKRGRTKIITVTPEGAYRGDINRHAEAVDRYRADVVPLRQAKQADETPPAA
jgi:predicted MarR family transcription regulator